MMYKSPLFVGVDFFAEECAHLLLTDAGPCVILIWTVLALGRRWSIRGWLDWSGVALGASCVLAFVAEEFVSYWARTR